MDKQQLLGYFQDHYLSRQDVLFKLPLNISIDSFWQDLVNQRKARATMLPLYSAMGQPYWLVTTDRMVKASERLCEEAMRHDSFFDPYRIPLSQALTSALSQEAYFTSYVEGADYPIQAAVDFLRRGSDPENAYEQNILNNYQAGSYLLSALSIPFDESFVKELAATLSDGQDGYRTTDTPVIPAMESESFKVPPAHMLADRMGQFYAFIADVRVHPLIKAAVGQAYILATRPFQEANERLGRLISNAILLRYGYDFFLDISISAYIARESYRYFKAMREIIRSDNDGDLTYFVEYYLELLVRALDGTRMEEAERLQSQLESERKMALQPLKQPTVQYTQPHSYSAEAVARVIDSAESNQEAEDAFTPQGDQNAERDQHAEDTTDGAAPDPPAISGDNGLSKAAQSQGKSIQDDRAVMGNSNYFYTVLERMENSKSELIRQTASTIRCMLSKGIKTFTRQDWAFMADMEAAKMRDACDYMVAHGLVKNISSRNRQAVYVFADGSPAETDPFSDVHENRPVSETDADTVSYLLRRLDELASGEATDRDRRISSIFTDFIKQGKYAFRAEDMERNYSIPKSTCFSLLRSAVNLGLIYRDDHRDADGQFTYFFNPEPVRNIRTDGLTRNQKEILSTLFKEFKKRSFAASEAANICKMSQGSFSFHLTNFSERGILTVKRVKGMPNSYVFETTPQKHPECFVYEKSIEKYHSSGNAVITPLPLSAAGF